MADYYINSDYGKQLAGSLKAGDMAEASDGSTWRKEADGSVTVWKNGQTMTGRVGVSAPAVSEAPSFSASPTVETPTLDAATGGSSQQTTAADYTGSAQEQRDQEQAQARLASEKAKAATEKVTAGLGQSSSDELLNQAIQQASTPEYKISSAQGVLLADELRMAGDMAEASDGSTWRREADGSISVRKGDRTYKANIDRAAAKQDPQWAILTAPAPAAAETGSGKKSSRKSSSGSASSGGSGTYTFPAASTGTQKTPTTTATGTDRASLRKQAATAQKEMGDLARQISVAKIRGKDTSALQAKYNEAKARYDAATTQIPAPKSTGAEGPTLIEAATRAPEKAAELAQRQAERAQNLRERQAEQEYIIPQQTPDEKFALTRQIQEKQESRDESVKIANTRKELIDISNQIKAGKARGRDTSALEAQYNGLDVYLNGLQAARAYQNTADETETRRGFGSEKPLWQSKKEASVSEAEFNRSSAMVRKYGSYDNYLRGVYAGYDKAREVGTRRRAAAVVDSGKVSEAEFNRSTTMVEQYGTYQNYLNGVRRSNTEIGQERAQRRIESLGIADLLEQYYNSEGEEQARLRQFLKNYGVTGEELNTWRNLFFSGTGARKYIGDLGTALFQGGMQQWQSGVEGALAGVENAANKAAAWTLNGLSYNLPEGKLKYGMNELADQLRSADTGHEKNAEILQQQLADTMRETTKDHSGAGKWVIEQMPSMGNMLLNSASAGMTGLPSLATLGTTAGGSAYIDARNDGASHEQALAYGIVNGALEVGSEKLFGGNPLYDTDAGLVNKLVSKLTKNPTILGILDNKGFDLLSEGLEEVVTEITEPWAQALIYAGKDADFATTESVANAFLGGVFMSAVGKAAALPGQLRSREAQTEINAAGQSVFRQALQTGDPNVQNAVHDVQSKIATGAQLTVEDIGHVLDVMAESNYEASPTQTAQDVSYSPNQTTQQTTQGTAERGAEDVITGNAASEDLAPNGLKKFDFQEVINLSTGKKNVIISTVNDFKRFIQNTLSNKGEFKRAYLGKVTDAAAQKAQSAGMDITNYTVMMSSDDIAHTFKRHGDAQAEAKSGQIAVTPDSLSLLTEVISNPDSVEADSRTDGRGRPVLLFRKYIDGNYVAVEAVSDSKKTISTDTMYIQKKNPHVAEYNAFVSESPVHNTRSDLPQGSSRTASVSDDTDVPARSGSTGQSPPGKHVPDAPYNTSYNPTVAQPGNSVNQNISPNDMGAMRSQFESVPKQAQTQSNTINSMETGWDVPEAQRTPIMYDTISEAKSLDNARLRLAQDYAGEMAELRGKHNWSGEEVDMGMTILDNYRRAAEQTGDWTEYSNWRKEVSAHGTAAGQALQAYAKYSRQTGGGIVADASAALERAAKKTNKAEVMNRVNALAQQYDAAVGTGQENAKVNVNDLVDIIKSASTARQTGTLIGNKTPPIVNWAMNRIANYAKAEAQSGGGENLDFLRTFAADSIYNIAADTRAVSAGEQVKTVRRMGMLSKVSTVMRNLVSNNVFDPIDSIARNVSVPLDMLVSTITGTRSVAGDASWFSAAKRKGSMDGLARACMEVGLDVDASGTAGKYENTSNRTFKMSSGVFSKLMSVWEAYEGYTLNATDEFQKGGIEASVQKGIDRLYEKGKITDDSLRNAGEQEALYRTFQDKTVLSDAAIGVRNALNKAHIGDIGAGDIMLPFAQVPSNLGARAIEYSPAGLGVAAADFINMIDAARKGEFTAAQQAKAVQGVGRALTGSGMIAIAAAGALRGWLKVTGDDDDKNKDALGKTHGLDGTQLNISAALRDLRGESAQWQAGDQLLSIGFLDPLNAQLTTGALIADDIRSEAGVTAGRVLGNSLSGALQSVLDTPVMSTFQDVATNYEYSGASTPGGKMMDAAQKYAANQLSSVIPNSLRGIAQGLDDTERNAYSSDNVWQQAIDNAKASIPGLRETLPAKTDVWGNPVKNEGGIRNFMNRNINPGNVTTYKPDAVSSEIEKISEATNTSLYPDRTAPRSLKVDGEAVSLTFEQRSMYQKAYGDAYSAAVTSLMNDKNYKAMPDSMKAEILQQAKDTATEQARDSLGIGYEVKSSAQKILEKSGAERNNALISAAVKAQHYLSPETQKQRSDVDRQFGGADYIGLSDELFNAAKEKANTYFSAVEAAKYGGELTETQKELTDKDSKELARYFMDKAIESRYTDANKSGTKADEYLKAYRHGELNDAMALAVLSDKEVRAYDRFGRSAKVTPEMALQAANAHAGMKDVKDEDGKVTSSAQDQFDAWLDKQSWTDDQKSAVRMGFYSDSVKTYSYLADQLRKGNIKTADAKSELTTSYQAGWSKNVRDTGTKMADYIDAIVEYEDRPSEEERKAAGYKNTWTWFCDYLNTTDLTQEQKFGIAISMSDYSDKTKQKIWNRLR